MNRHKAAANEFADRAVGLSTQQFNFLLLPRRLKRCPNTQCLAFEADRFDSAPDPPGDYGVGPGAQQLNLPWCPPGLCHSHLNELINRVMTGSSWKPEVDVATAR